MLKRVLAIIISVLVLSLGISVIGYIPQEQREPDVGYMERTGIFIFASYIYFIFL